MLRSSIAVVVLVATFLTISASAAVAPAIVGPLTTNGNVGRSLVYQLQVTGTAPVTVTIDPATSLPRGLKFDKSLFRVTGIPFVSGVFPVNFTATNATGSANATVTFMIDSATAGISKGTVKYSDSAIDKLKTLGSGADAEIDQSTTTKVMITVTVNLSAAEQASISDSSTCNLALGNYTFNNTLSAADKIQTGKKYTFFETTDVQVGNSDNSKTVKVGTTTVSINRSKLTIQISRTASDLTDAGTASVVAETFQGTTNPAIKDTVPVMLEIGTVELDFFVPFTGKSSVKSVTKGHGDNAQGPFDLSSVSTKGGGASQ